MVSTSAESASQRIAIIGSGPVGVYFVNELYRLDYPGQVVLLGEEAHAPYNRVQLSNLLNGSCPWEDLVTRVNLKSQWEAHYHTRIASIDRDFQRLWDTRGNVYSYDILVIATGSRPHVPAIPGVGLDGVFAFRNLDDTQQLLSRQVSSRHTVVIGGGLLGIETARSMAKYGTRVTLIHHSPILMNRQLDERASSLLVENLFRQGVEVQLSTSVLAIDGSRRVERILTRNKTPLSCDTVIFTTGIKPNLELAREAGIWVGQGIKINEYLQTSREGIYAIGECAEFNGRIFGLVAPGLEQAGILASNLVAENSLSTYRETLLSASLKVVDDPVFSSGDVGEEYNHSSYKNLVYETDNCYRKIVLSRGRLVGAIGLGEWPEQEILRDAIGKRKYIHPLRRLLFSRRGCLFADDPNPTSIPGNAVICNCRQISAAVIRNAVESGCKTIEALGERCGAGLVCGSCQPLMAKFTEQNVKPSSQKWLAGWAVCVALLIAAFFLLPPLAVSASYNPGSSEKWWTSSFYRQITGFSVLALMAAGLLVGLRKRLRWFRWLKFERWRWLHVILSTLCIIILFVHTGLGEIRGLNRWLLLSFMAAATMGILTSLLTQLETASPGIANKSFKRWFTTAHLVSFWPVPVLLALHIVTVYWF